MTPNTDLESIFVRAMDLPPTDVGAFLKRACGGNAELYDQAVNLLDANRRNRAEQWLNQPPGPIRSDKVELGPASEQIGDTIGRYRLLSKLGEGGMGVVYRAEVAEQDLPDVALKVVKVGMDTQAILNRFHLERRSLGLFQHRCIARLLDVGTTETGRPFFAMELVQGTNICSFVREHSLTLTQVLQLLAEVCRAVHHAHQKGVIHRDIKPSNILVQSIEGSADPKVIDFGIAKLTHPCSDSALKLTHPLSPMGTPKYMSPEQCGPNRNDIDTRSDVFSLGVLVEELEQDFAASSAAVAKPLKWVIEKATAEDRELRYASANDLGEDLLRLSEGLPVLAAPASIMYRLATFSRRHRVATVFAFVTSLAFTALLCLCVMMGWNTFQTNQKLTSANSLLTAKNQQLSEARVDLERAMEIKSHYFCMSVAADQFDERYGNQIASIETRLLRRWRAERIRKAGPRISDSDAAFFRFYFSFSMLLECPALDNPMVPVQAVERLRDWMEFDERILDDRILEDRVLENRVLENRVLENRVLENRVTVHKNPDVESQDMRIDTLTSLAFRERLVKEVRHLRTPFFRLLLDEYMTEFGASHAATQQVQLLLSASLTEDSREEEALRDLTSKAP